MLFATETAASVLDIQAMNWVLQFDYPEEANSYSQSIQTCQVDDEALLILLPSEEKGMVQQLLQKKVPVKEIK